MANSREEQNRAGLGIDLNPAARLFETAYNMEPNALVGAKLIESKAFSNFEEGLELAKKMSLLYPKNPDILLSYGRLLAAKGEMKDAEKNLRSAVKLRPENLEGSVLLIQILQTQGHTKEAIDVAHEMVERNADFTEGFIPQVEVAGVLKSSDQPELAKAFLAYLLTPEAQKIIPVTNWMYPVLDIGADLPAAFGTPPAKVIKLDEATIAEKGQAWVDAALAALN